MTTPVQNRQHTAYILLTGLLIAFPFPALMAFLLLMLQKALAFHRTGFNLVLGLLTLIALSLFLNTPQLAYYVSIIPLWKAGLSQGLGGVFKVLGQLAGSPKIVRACFWAGAPVAWGLIGAFTLMDDQPKAPAPAKAPPPQVQGKPTQEGALLGELGRRGSGRFCSLSPEELNKHVALIGTTGSGKTTTLRNFVQYGLEKEQATIVIDGKGDVGLASLFETMALAQNRPFRLFCMTDPSNLTLSTLSYNPFTTGNATELTDKLMSLSDWSEEHYKLSAQRFLQLLFRAFKLKGVLPDLATITRYTNQRQLVELLVGNPIAAPGQKRKSIITNSLNLDDLTTQFALSDEERELIASLETIDVKAINGLASRLGILAEGSLRDMFKTDSQNTLDLFEAIEEKAFIVFSLDSLLYPEQARLLGRLIVADIKAQISYHGRHRAGQRVLLIFDEFNIFASSTVVDLVNKSRAAGFEAVLSFQSLADIDCLEHGEYIRRQIIQNCNTLIVHRQNDRSDAEELAQNIGTKDSMIITQQISIDGPTGLGSIRPEKAFKVHPDQIKELNIGEAFIKRHTAKGTTVNKLWIRQI
jgi:DNA helicase HerA-like ATPase